MAKSPKKSIELKNVKPEERIFKEISQTRDRRRQIRNKFGILIPNKYCKHTITEFGALRDITKSQEVIVEDENLLARMAGNEAEYRRQLEAGEHIEYKSVKDFYFGYYLRHKREKEYVEGLEQLQSQLKPKPQSQPEGQPQPQPQGQPEGQPQPQPQGQPEDQPQPQSQGQPEGQPQPQPQSQPKGQPQLQPQGQPEGQPQPQLQNQPEDQPQPQPQNQPEDQPQPQPQSQPEDQPQPQPQSQPETSQPQPNHFDEPHDDFYKVTDSELEFKKLIIETYKTFGRDHMIAAFKLYGIDNGTQLLLNTPKINEFINKNDSNRVLEIVSESYIKRVLRRMKEKKLGNSKNPKEKFLEELIVKTYMQKASSNVDDIAIIEYIQKAFCEFLTSDDIGIFGITEETTALKKFVSQSEVLKIMLDAEVDSVLQKKGLNGKSLLKENELDLKIKKFEAVTGRLELNEDLFIDKIENIYDNASEIQQSTLGANLYASLNVNKRDENQKRANLVKNYINLKNEINSIRMEIINLEAKIIAAGNTENILEIEETITQLKTTLRDKLDNFEKFINRPYSNGKSNLLIIGDYESRIKALKKLDEKNDGKTKMKYIDAKEKRQEVVDIE